MTAREMQIDFEKSLILINPEFALKEKVTTDEIFIALNKAQKRYVEMNYLGAEQMEDGKRIQKKNVSALRSLITVTRLSSVQYPNLINEVYINDDAYYDAYTYDNTSKTLLFSPQHKITFVNSISNNSLPFTLPGDFFLYINSVSLTITNYRRPTPVITDVKLSEQPIVLLRKTQLSPVSNRVIKEDSVPMVMTTSYNSPILREPCVLYNKTNLEVIADKFTLISAVDLKYYRTPTDISIIPNADCELPKEVHKDIIDLAVEIYLTEGKYKLNMKQPKQEQPKQEA